MNVCRKIFGNYFLPIRSLLFHKAFSNRMSDLASLITNREFEIARDREVDAKKIRVGSLVTLCERSASDNPSIDYFTAHL